MLNVSTRAIEALRPYIEGKDARGSAIRVVFQGFG